MRWMWTNQPVSGQNVWGLNRPLKPELVCEVGFAEVTSDGVFRQASFKGMRTDKNAKDVVLETPVTRPKETTSAKDKKPDLALAPVKNTERKTLLIQTEDTQV